jgi:cyclopropane fatty-acyl-phospholipid synthase-like methyltransferase
MLDASDYVSSEAEKERYSTHNNDINDIRYQEFVSPIVEAVKKSYKTNHLGLDYGAGTGPVITSLLEKEGYSLNLYDPYFHDYPNNLQMEYDYIVCCEVMEHFHHPHDEFRRLYNLLNLGGSLFCMTSLYDESIDFESWYYKNDETHVFLYHRKGLEWIKNEFGFLDVCVEGKLIQFKK